MTKSTATHIAIIFGLTCLAYLNSLSAPFVFDDEVLTRDPYLQDLWPIWEAAKAPEQTTLSGRPVAAISFAINYAITGLSPTGFRVGNILIHATSAITLFFLLKLVLDSSQIPELFKLNAGSIAFWSALLWALHPLQTESVTYIIQRTESLCGLFYLLTIYAVLKSRYTVRRRTWQFLAIFFCGLGMGSKEVMVTAPVVALVIDRILHHESTKHFLRNRWPLYGGLFATWIILAFSIAGAPRSATAGFELSNITPLAYARTQLEVIIHYIRLTFWPAPLCIDYGWPIAESWRAVVVPGVFIASLILATILLLMKKRPAALLGVWFFVILAPTSSIVPIADPAFEHRMYLPLAAVTFGFVLLLLRIFAGRQAIEPFRSDAADNKPPNVQPRYLLPVAAISLAFLSMTIERNRDYQSPAALWASVVKAQPDNWRGQVNLAHAMFETGNIPSAIHHYQKAVKLNPAAATARVNLGVALESQGRLTEALAQYHAAEKLTPNDVRVNYNLGLAYQTLGNHEMAIEYFEKGLRLDPQHQGLRQALSESRNQLKGGR